MAKNIKARNNATKRLQKIDYFLDLIEGMSHSLDEEDAQGIAAYLQKRLITTCDKLTGRIDPSDVFRLVNTSKKAETESHDIYCGKCDCWHDKAIHAGEDKLGAGKDLKL